MKINERIKILREEYNPPLSQSELGKKLNKSQRAISRLETGEAHMQMRILLHTVNFSMCLLTIYSDCLIKNK